MIFRQPRSKARRGAAGDRRRAQARRARQVALAFLTRAPSVFAIPKASSAEHAADNAAAGNLKLSDGEIAALDKAFPRGPKPRGLPMLVSGTRFLTKCFNDTDALLA